MPERVGLGRTGIQISPLGIGTWQWGDRLFWGYGQGGYSDEDLHRGFLDSLEAGINFFDTAEAYGSGRSETLLGQYTRQAGQPLVIATKFTPLPWKLRPESLLETLRRSLKRLGIESVDLYQAHWPLPLVPVESWAKGMAEVVRAGLARSVGVSNYNVKQMRSIHAALEKLGIPLASNQVPYSLYERKHERSGLPAACRELGITLIAYSPLEKGLLTGKYTPQNPMPGVRGLLYNRSLMRVQPLIGMMREIGRSHGGKSPAQVALNWAICKGAVPIPGAKNSRQAQENLGALGWKLAEEEVAALERASDRARGK